MQCCQLGFKLVKSFSFLPEFKILFELRFKTFSQKKIPKSIEEKIMEITLTAQKESVFGVVLVRIFTAFSRIQSECGKNADRNNSEYKLFLRCVSLNNAFPKYNSMPQALVS